MRGPDKLRAIEVLIKLEAREARLLGLDAPVKIAETDPEGNTVPMVLARDILLRVIAGRERSAKDAAVNGTALEDLSGDDHKPE